MKFPKVSRGQIYLVGGAVRDFVHMDLTTDKDRYITDRDYVVIGTTKENLQRDFPNGQWDVGKAFPVLKIQQGGFLIDIAMGRRETKIAEGYRGFSVDFGPEVTLEEDLSRRDLTMNAMAMDEDGHIIDPYNGTEDIKKGVLRHVTDAFREDPLRVYRLARFASKFGFIVDEGTIRLAKSLMPELFSLSSDRVMAEFLKVFSTSYPWRFFEVLEECSCKAVHFNDIRPESSGEISKAIQYGANNILIAAMLLSKSSEQSFKQFVKRMVLPNNYWSAAAQLLDFSNMGGLSKDNPPEVFIKMFDSLSRGSLGIENLSVYLLAMDRQDEYVLIRDAYTVYISITGARLQAELISKGEEVPVGKEFGDLLRKKRTERIAEKLV